MSSQSSTLSRRKKPKDENDLNTDSSQINTNKPNKTKVLLSEKAGSSGFDPSSRNKKLHIFFSVLLILIRITGAIYSNINDCDEVFNYWEPTHFIQYKHGLQTWEYSPEYAIRSWAYVLIHYLPLRVFEFFTSSKMTQFYLLRMLLACLSGYFEISLCNSISSFLSPKLSTFTLLFLLGSSGMFHAAPAYLPSSFAMLTTIIFFSNAIKPTIEVSRKNKALQALGIGCLLGWPFSAAVGIPFALEEIIYSSKNLVSSEEPSLLKWSRNLVNLILSSLKYFLYITIPILSIDYYFYQKITLVPFNIVLYNVLGASADSGPNIFGTEPWFFYLLNLFLNFNLGFVLALTSFFILLIDYTLFQRNFVFGTLNYTAVIIRLSPVYWWLLIYSLQPHKEERFMFIIYPLMAFNAAASVFLVHTWFLEIGQKVAKITEQAKEKARLLGTFLVTVCLFLFILLSFLRTYGQFRYYNGPMKLYGSISAGYPSNVESLENNNTSTVLCLGDEWYRFPSHYFLPDYTRLSFIKAGFNGLLPKPFKNSNSLWESTSVIPSTMNNKNKEESDRYVSLHQCSLLVLNLPSFEEKDKLPAGWEILSCFSFLNPKSIPSWQRAFYFPSSPVLNRAPTYDKYCVLKNKNQLESDIK